MHLKILRSVFTAIGFSLATSVAVAQDLKVRIEGAGDKGTIHLYVFSTAQGFPKEENAAVHATYPWPGGDFMEIMVKVPDAPGYALMAYQDKNEDGKMNRFLGMIPQEPYALSRNPQVMGKPKFSDAMVHPAENETIVLKLRD